MKYTSTYIYCATLETKDLGKYLEANYPSEDLQVTPQGECVIDETLLEGKAIGFSLRIRGGNQVFDCRATYITKNVIVLEAKTLKAYDRSSTCEDFLSIVSDLFPDKKIIFG